MGDFYRELREKACLIPDEEVRKKILKKIGALRNAEKMQCVGTS